MVQVIQHSSETFQHDDRIQHGPVMPQTALDWAYSHDERRRSSYCECTLTENINTSLHTVSHCYCVTPVPHSNRNNASTSMYFRLQTENWSIHPHTHPPTHPPTHLVCCFFCYLLSAIQVTGTARKSIQPKLFHCTNVAVYCMSELSQWGRIHH